MKELLRQFAAYNTWANQKIAEVLLSLPEEMVKQPVASSFTSIHETILHMWTAESIWWQRLKLQEVVVAPVTNFNGSPADAIQAMLQQNRMWEDWIQSATDMAIDHVFSYYNTKRELFKQPTYQVLMHVMNHGTYHRGQIVNMLRQLGHDKIPQTDFIVWSRAKK